MWTLNPPDRTAHAYRLYISDLGVSDVDVVWCTEGWWFCKGDDHFQWELFT